MHSNSGGDGSAGIDVEGADIRNLVVVAIVGGSGDVGSSSSIKQTTDMRLK